MRVLLIEDDPDLGEGIRTSLREEGYTLDWLKDGESAVHALRACASQPPRVVS